MEYKMVNINEISYNGWKHCLEMKNNHLKLIVTTDIGPRVIYLAGRMVKMYSISERDSRGL